MKLCIAGYNNRVATLCEHAQQFLLYEYQDEQLRAAGSLPVPADDPAGWGALLRAQGVQLLICGGLCRHTQRLLGCADIEVRPWICGPVERVLEAFTQDRLADCLMPGHAQRRPGRGGGQGGRGRGQGQGLGQDGSCGQNVCRGKAGRGRKPGP